MAGHVARGQRRRAGRDREDGEAACRVVGGGAEQHAAVGEDERRRVDARHRVRPRLQILHADDDRRPPGRDAPGHERCLRRVDVVDPGAQHVLAAHRPVDVRQRRRVDREVVRLRPREDGARRADVELVVEREGVDVRRRAGVALDVVLVQRAEQPRVHERAGRRGLDRGAEVHDRLADVHHVGVLDAALVDGRAGVGRRAGRTASRASGTPRRARRRDASGRAARRASATASRRSAAAASTRRTRTGSSA